MASATLCRGGTLSRGEDVGVGADAGTQERCPASLSPAPSVGPHWHRLPVAVLSPLRVTCHTCSQSSRPAAAESCHPGASAQAQLHLRPQGAPLSDSAHPGGQATCLVPASLEGGIAGNEHTSLANLSQFSSPSSYL